MYCECFAKGVKCGPHCGCTGCSNHESNADEIDNARLGILKRNPQAFKFKVKQSE